jgi:hypothetical protein
MRGERQAQQQSPKDRPRSLAQSDDSHPLQMSKIDSIRTEEKLPRAILARHDLYLLREGLIDAAIRQRLSKDRAREFTESSSLQNDLLSAKHRWVVDFVERQNGDSVNLCIYRTKANSRLQQILTMYLRTTFFQKAQALSECDDFVIDNRRYFEPDRSFGLLEGKVVKRAQGAYSADFTIVGYTELYL